MKQRNLLSLKKAAVLALATILLYGCAASGGGQRKKMPEFANSEGEFEAFQPFKNQKSEGYGLGFNTINTDVMYNGVTTECVSVTLPSSLDAQASALFSLYKPLAGVLLGEWAKQQRNGVVIDLKSAPGPGGSRADYQIKNPDDSSIPVIFLWNNQSAARASLYISMLSEVPGVTVKLLSDK